MFPIIIKTKTRVNTDGAKPVVQFYDASGKSWQEDINLDFSRAGIAIFVLDMNPKNEEYIFFGAVQKTECGSDPDTNWDFKINLTGSTISFVNDCKNKQEIDIKLTLIPRGDDNISDKVVSADPKLRNEPD